MNVLAAFYTGALGMFIALALTWIGMRRRAFLWHFIAALIFLALAVYGFSIPFEVSPSGYIVGNPANYLFIGFSLIGLVFNTFYALKYAFELLR